MMEDEYDMNRMKELGGKFRSFDTRVNRTKRIKSKKLRELQYKNEYVLVFYNKVAE